MKTFNRSFLVVMALFGFSHAGMAASSAPKIQIRCKVIEFIMYRDRPTPDVKVLGQYETESFVPVFASAHPRIDVALPAPYEDITIRAVLQSGGIISVVDKSFMLTHVIVQSRDTRQMPYSNFYVGNFSGFSSGAEVNSDLSFYLDERVGIVSYCGIIAVP